MLKVLSPASGSLSTALPASTRRKTAAVLWIDAQDPSPQEMEELAARFGWHHLSVEDALRPQQRPKVETYDSYQFIVVYAAGYQDQRLTSTELDIFLGADYIVSVHRGPLPEIEEARQRWEGHPHLPKGGGSIFLLYALLDAVVDSYFPVVEALSERVEDVEERLFSDFQQELLRETVALRREMLSLSRVIAPQRDVVDHLMRGEPLLHHPELIAYFTDVHDHLLRVNESLVLQRELLGNVQEGYLSLASNNLNQVMRVLTAVATILMTLGLLAGIYGMNFQNMPELGWRFGYFLILGFMGLVGGGLVAYFRRRGWL